MSAAWALAAAGLNGLLAVGLGAFGAHALKPRLLAADTLSAWDTAVLYHLVHSAALLGLAAWWRASGASMAGPAIAFLLGMLMFSGSLYWLALGGPRWLGPVTPIGGTALLAGWGLIVWHALGRPG
ncbi:MAG: DUF423 domain-containing protein [Pseudomonadota bacterium]